MVGAAGSDGDRTCGLQGRQGVAGGQEQRVDTVFRAVGGAWQGGDAGADADLFALVVDQPVGFGRDLADGGGQEFGFRAGGVGQQDRELTAVGAHQFGVLRGEVANVGGEGVERDVTADRHRRLTGVDRLGRAHRGDPDQGQRERVLLIPRRLPGACRNALFGQGDRSRAHGGSQQRHDAVGVADEADLSGQPRPGDLGGTQVAVLRRARRPQGVQRDRRLRRLLLRVREERPAVGDQRVEAVPLGGAHHVDEQDSADLGPPRGQVHPSGEREAQPAQRRRGRRPHRFRQRGRADPDGLVQLAVV
nr:hypothetical protein [Actinokineospora iranica]